MGAWSLGLQLYGAIVRGARIDTSGFHRESGVRNLKKQLEKIYRKVALQLVKRGAVAREEKAEADQAAQSSSSASGEECPVMASSSCRDALGF